MTVFDAERLIRAFWGDPPRTPLLYAARLSCLLERLSAELTDVARWALAERLGYRKERRWDKHTDITPSMEILRGLMDRRKQLGIAEPMPNVDQGYRLRHVRSRSDKLEKALSG